MEDLDGKDTILEVKNLSFRYPEYSNFKTAILFSNLNLKIKKGSVSLVLAPPDTGKTTLARIFSGLVPRFSGGYIGGSVFLNGKDVLKTKPYDLIEDVGMVFQNPDEQILTTSCDTEIAFALESLGYPREEIILRVERALERVALSMYKNENPHNLSGGEKKRLMIAALFAISPSLYIFDETFDELDSDIRRDLLVSFYESGETVLLFVSKWFDIYREIVTDYYLLYKGELVQYKRENIEDFLGDSIDKNILFDSSRIYIEWVNKKAKKNNNLLSDNLPLIKVDNVKFYYDKSGLEEVNENRRDFSLSVPSFSVYKGEVVSVLGKNGSGKSTFAKILCGILKPESGMVMIPGIDNKIEGKENKGESNNSKNMKNTTLQEHLLFKEASSEELNSYVGYIFQDPDYQIFLPTIYEELALGLKLKGTPKEEIESIVSRIARDFLLPSLETPPTLLSFGAKRKLQAATYYILERKVLILDEMDSGISSVDLVLLLSKLYSSRRALIFITHDIEMAKRVSNRMFLFDDGSLIEIE